LLEGEFSSILASPLRFLRLLDHPIRPRQHIRRNGQTVFSLTSASRIEAARIPKLRRIQYCPRRQLPPATPRTQIPAACKFFPVDSYLNTVQMSGAKCHYHSSSKQDESSAQNKIYLITRSARARTFGGIVRPRSAPLDSAQQEQNQDDN
jgi:hypothetical protein